MNEQALSTLDYRFLLQDELDLRRKKNASYSLRAFAKHLGVSPAYLSQLFSQKRGLSEKVAFQFAQKLNWKGAKKKIFVELIRYEKTKDVDTRHNLLRDITSYKKNIKYRDLRIDEFEFIAQWIHAALLEMISLKNFRAEPKWLAKRLGVSQTDIEVALRRLLRIGLLKFENSVLVKSDTHFRIRDISSEAIRQFHKTHLQRAESALEKQSQEERDITGITLAFDRKKLDQVREAIRQFRADINQLCSESDSKDSIYQLSIQFFRLDQGEVL
jgi:uncharacterized protein (TIGR02147 family)